MRVREPVEFVPVGIVGQAHDEATLLAAPEPPPTTRHQDDRAGRIEIDLPNGVRVRVDSFVNEKALARVFRALKGAL